MTAHTITTEFGHSLPPEGPHTVTFHIPGWDIAMRFRDGDTTIFPRLRSMYPRMAPFGPIRQLSMAIAQKLNLPETVGVLMYTDPAAFVVHKQYSLSPHRKEHSLSEGDLSFKVVEIHDIRLYCVIYQMAKTKGVIGVWQNSGTGMFTRPAEELLKYVHTEFKVVTWSGDLEDIPSPTYYPESEAHGQLRKRISDLLHRAPLDPDKVRVKPDDVYLYQTGMGAIHRLNEALLKRDPGTILVLGSVFSSTWHLFNETSGGMKHIGDAGNSVMAKIEKYLEAHYREGKTVSYVFLEFPSNPILVSVDLRRLRQVADRYNLPVVVDDTVGSFCNIDVLPVTDFVATSCTKSFSGYADVMAGSVVLNPLSPFYASVKHTMDSTFHNEFFAADAEALLKNSNNYLSRSATLNRNAAALADYLATKAADPASPVSQVLYPTRSDTRDNYEAFMRNKTPDFTPGYGCLLSVEFEDLGAARAFYDSIQLHCGPHLGAHFTLAVPFNAIVNGRTPEEAKYHANYGARPEQIRISVGLEDQEEILSAVEEALGKIEETRMSAEDVAVASADVVTEKVSEGGKTTGDVKATAANVAASYEGSA
ncbi:putative secondary metabolism biosynthetic enzyme [Diaporthe australafricana]|uniref:Secondary metabolism biosynthetic enzyme n=1 Tax=Diaporthe australafricana TaxID=127596 RepID=A0ABR3WPY4_9PEZI